MAEERRCQNFLQKFYGAGSSVSLNESKFTTCSSGHSNCKWSGYTSRSGFRIGSCSLGHYGDSGECCVKASHVHAYVKGTGATLIYSVSGLTTCPSDHPNCRPVLSGRMVANGSAAEAVAISRTGEHRANEKHTHEYEGNSGVSINTLRTLGTCPDSHSNCTFGGNFDSHLWASDPETRVTEEVRW